jgi:hypothetical protein
MGSTVARADDLVVIPSPGVRKERSDMYPVVNLAAAHIDDLLAEAAADRLARSARGTNLRPNRIAGAARRAWSLLAGSDKPALDLPKLTDYPYRG